MIGNFKNAGQSWCLEAEVVNDHDFETESQGRAAPYGIYDLNHNRGYVYVGQSADTAEFAVDILSGGWQQFGQVEFPNAPCLRALCDCGGSNGFRSRLWKAQLQEKLADTLGMTVIVCHYPLRGLSNGHFQVEPYRTSLVWTHHPPCGDQHQLGSQTIAHN